MAASGCCGQVVASGCKWLQVAAQVAASSKWLLKWLQVAAGSKWLQVAAFAKFKIRVICTLSGRFGECFWARNMDVYFSDLG